MLLVREQAVAQPERLQVQQVKVRWMASVCNLPIQKLHPPADSRRLDDVASVVENPFHERSLRHRQLRSLVAARIQPDFDQHGDWPHNEERVKRRVDDLA